jgi:hypothetical protein
MEGSAVLSRSLGTRGSGHFNGILIGPALTALEAASLPGLRPHLKRPDVAHRVAIARASSRE